MPVNMLEDGFLIMFNGWAVIAEIVSKIWPFYYDGDGGHYGITMQKQYAWWLLGLGLDMVVASRDRLANVFLTEYVSMDCR